MRLGETLAMVMIRITIITITTITTTTTTTTEEEIDIMRYFKIISYEFKFIIILCLRGFGVLGFMEIPIARQKCL